MSLTKYFLIIVALWAGLASVNAAADDMLYEIPSDSRIKTLLYDETDVYTITTKYGYQTNVIFGSLEEIQTISVGDRSLWQIIPTGNRLFIRPMVEDSITNMTVITNKHSYYFDLKSVGDGKNSGNIYVAKFIYKDEKKKDASLKEIPVVAANPVTANPSVATTKSSTTTGAGPALPVLPNYNYTYAGPDDLAPIQVFDDGKSTYIRYQNLTPPLPDVYTIDASGHEQLVSYYLNPKNLVVVDAIASEMLLKSSTGSVYIYNETLSPGDVSTKSGRE